MNTKSKQNQTNEQQMTRQQQGSKQQGQTSNTLPENRKVEDHERPETRLTR